MNTNFTDKVLCVGLRTSCLGTTAMDRDATARVLAQYEAKDGKMRVSKTILADAIKPARQRRAQARKWFNSVTLPGISDDLRITTPSRLPEIQKEVQRIRDEDEKWLKTVLVPNYERHKAQDRADLGSAYDPSLYPAAEDLHHHFNILLTVTDMPQGDYARVQGLSAVAKQEMEEQHQKMLAHVGAQARNEVYQHLVKLVAHIAEKMSNPDAKNYRDATFDNLKEYLKLVPDLNITGDPVLEQFRKEAEEKLSYSMKVVKESDFLKQQAAEAAKDLMNRFGKVSGGRRLVA